MKLFHFTGSNVNSILKLAHEYQVKEIMEKCEAFLMKTPSIENLVIGEKFDLTKLQKVCVEYAIKQPIRNDWDARKLDNVSKENQVKIYQEKCFLLSKENETRNMLIGNISNQIKQFNYKYAHISGCDDRSGGRGIHGHTYSRCSTCLCEVIKGLFETQ